MIAALSFAEQIVANLVGPALTVILGTLIIGFWANRIARNAQARREDHALRERLLTQVTEAATRLYIATQRFWRAKKREPTDQLEELREALDEQYQETRVSGMALEQLLGLHFEEPEPKRLCHRVMDLLTIRYFQLTSGATVTLREKNKGEDHTGLSVIELKNSRMVLEKYHETLAELVAAIETGTLVVGKSSRPRELDGLASARHNPVGVDDYDSLRGETA